MKNRCSEAPWGPKIMTNWSYEAPWGYLGGPWAPQGVPGEKTTSFWDLFALQKGLNFWCFFDILGVFFDMFFECVFGRPPDHFFMDFGVILGDILEYFSMFFQDAGNLEK